MRINKFLSESGICSRREADKHIADGKVKIDGKQAVIGSKVMPGNKVTFNGRPVKNKEKRVLIALNKPVGIVSTTDRRDPNNIVDFVNHPKRIFPIGRLDKDSEGLILLTNDGDIVNLILRERYGHEKEYIVTVNKEITKEFVTKMSEGVPILGTVTKPCKIIMINKNTFRIILTQGLNRQIRRMCEYLGYKVTKLVRVRIINIDLGRLKTGTWRNISDKELAKLKEIINYEED
ncbi:MAG: 23S rRNA pseudouridine(2604) synthase RluF [Clostridiales bacterium]|nr:23S rRNA pseudouridine(2604) synthase RluF [Clostridiales bacterium]